MTDFEIVKQLKTDLFYLEDNLHDLNYILMNSEDLTAKELEIYTARKKEVLADIETTRNNIFYRRTA